MVNLILMNPLTYLVDYSSLVKAAARQLTDCWRANPGEHLDNPVVYTALDEAATEDSNSGLSLLYHLETVLRPLWELPLFALSLSTIPRVTITCSMSPKKYYDSTRIQSTVLKYTPSFRALGWDQCAEPYPVHNGDVNLTKVDSLAYQASLGRPL